MGWASSTSRQCLQPQHRVVNVGDLRRAKWRTCLPAGSALLGAVGSAKEIWLQRKWRVAIRSENEERRTEYGEPVGVAKGWSKSL